MNSGQAGTVTISAIRLPPSTATGTATGTSSAFRHLSPVTYHF
ncbi:MAG: hypothetical protein ACKOKB_03960 [Bacteroidota bacterium]